MYFWATQKSPFLWSRSPQSSMGMLCLAPWPSSPQALRQGTSPGPITSPFPFHMLFMLLLLSENSTMPPPSSASSTATSAPLPVSRLWILKQVAGGKSVATFRCCVKYNDVRSHGLKSAGIKKTKHFSLCFSTTQHLLVISNLTSESVSLGTLKWMGLILETS